MNKEHAQTVGMYRRYLIKAGIPKKTVTQIFDAFVEAAADDISELRMERIFTAIAWGVHTEFDLGAKDIEKLILGIGDLLWAMGPNNDDLKWEEVAKALRDETGIIFKNENDRYTLDYVAEELE